MKKMLLSVALIIGMGAAGFAQEADKKEHGHKPKSPEEMAQAQTNKLAEKLSLNDDQKKKVYALKLERSKKFANEMKGKHEEMMGKRDEMLKDQQAEDEKLEQILTPAQKESYEKLKADRKEKIHSMQGKGKRMGKRPGRMYDLPGKRDSSKVIN
ncbi:hypothetical protein SAMN05216436_12714 [bacterium A37T11]|nr:hypothetical protein SAMN05216436_12714 [bacterium A37T11]